MFILLHYVFTLRRKRVEKVKKELLDLIPVSLLVRNYNIYLIGQRINKYIIQESEVVDLKKLGRERHLTLFFFLKKI